MIGKGRKKACIHHLNALPLKVATLVAFYVAITII